MAFRTLLGESNMMAYLAMMAPRLVELRRVLKPTGSIYLHCDPTASHYLKLLMDAVFGPAFFRERDRLEAHQRSQRFAPGSHGTCRIHDVLLYYCERPERQDLQHARIKPHVHSPQRRRTATSSPGRAVATTRPRHRDRAARQANPALRLATASRADTGGRHSGRRWRL